MKVWAQMISIGASGALFCGAQIRTKSLIDKRIKRKLICSSIINPVKGLVVGSAARVLHGRSAVAGRRKNPVISQKKVQHDHDERDDLLRFIAVASIGRGRECTCGANHRCRLRLCPSGMPSGSQKLFIYKDQATHSGLDFFSSPNSFHDPSDQRTISSSSPPNIKLL
jgi:hypothetical protein